METADNLHIAVKTSDYQQLLKVWGDWGRA